VSKQAYEEKLAEVEALRTAEVSDAIAGVRRALKDRSNYVVSKAAEVARARELRELVPELVTAYERFFENAVKSDPQCWAKVSVAKALSVFEFEDAAPFVRGLKHVQMEPVWGGQSDTAGPLRAQCALALTRCRVPNADLMTWLTDALADPDKTVRTEAVRAMATVPHYAARLLIRLKVLSGDEPEVLGTCFAALLEVDPNGMEFVERFLQSSDTGAEAAIAIGNLRTDAAARVLREKYDEEQDPWFRGVLLSALALTRQEDAVEFLLRLVEREERDAEQAVDALGAARLSDEVRERVARAVQDGSPKLRRAFESAFGSVS
jgi:HEAT repeat protein